MMAGTRVSPCRGTKMDAEQRFLDAMSDEVEPALLLRRALHQVPELGMKEQRTSALITEALEMPVQRILGTGLLARVGGPGAEIWVRAELDALPIPEATGATFAAASGLMHACGHDVHLAALVAFARTCRRMAVGLPAPIVAVFQPREEGSPSGARTLVS